MIEDQCIFFYKDMEKNHFFSIDGKFPIPKEGEIIHLSQKNSNKDKWNVEGFADRFKVLSISKQYIKSYPHSGNISDIKIRCYIDVVVKPVKS